MSYRDLFRTVSAARAYAEETYGADTYASFLWSIERLQIAQVVASHHAQEFDYLDFACGTGRVFFYVRPLARSATGIDISPAMIDEARRVDPAAHFICKDITNADDVIEAKYDIITAFRFALNAEPGLLRSALCALRQRLRDSDSMIVLNNHGNLLSHKAVLWPLYVIRRRGRRAAAGNYMTHRQVVEACSQAGLVATRVAGCGLFGGRIATIIGIHRVATLERWFASSPFSLLGSNQMYEARL